MALETICGDHVNSTRVLYCSHAIRLSGGQYRVGGHCGPAAHHKEGYSMRPGFVYPPHCTHSPIHDVDRLFSTRVCMHFLSLFNFYTITTRALDRI